MPLASQLRSLPNLLTMARLFILPFLVIQILDGDYHAAFILFVLAGISDGLDGLLARLLNQKTKLGLYLDPIADKLLLSTLFIVLTIQGFIPRYVTVLVFSRDLGILLIATLLFFTHTLRDFPPSLLGKISTCIQIVTLTAIMSQRVIDLHQLDQALPILLKVIAWLAPLSAAQYAWIVIRRVSAEPHPH